MGSSSVPSLPERPCFNDCTNVPASGDLLTRSKDLESNHSTAALAIIPNSSKASRQSSLQGWTASGDGGIFLPDIPKWFAYVRKSELVFFQVPQVIGCNLEAFIVCAVCSSSFNEHVSPTGISIFVTNYTKLINFAVRPDHLTEITSDEVVWQVNLSNKDFNLEGGDFVEVEAVTGSSFTVKNTGVGLVWDPKLVNENKIESEPIPYECESSLRPAASFDHDLSDENRPSQTSRQEQQPMRLQVHQLKSGSSSQAKPKVRRRNPCSCWW
ncbi:uncharacterized protein LOC133744334 [Rosa rugosa]|uniref:uncharacterized protein LOC133744334 n=1 Tax=Rosa rugosa TaxID=74645 RepID=UPI002B413D55|nr:uncharacterized protein LOC133744334 [Rosa rugosa]